MTDMSGIAEGWFNLVMSELGILSEDKKSLAEVRLKICSVCQFRNENTCKKCGCFIKAKALSSSSCPIGSW